METTGLIDACELCGEFKKVEVITVNDTWIYCCSDCEKNLSDKEE